MKIYKNQKSDLTVVSGVVKSVADDRKSIVMKSVASSKNAEGKYEYTDKDVNIKAIQPFGEEIVAGKMATVVAKSWSPDPAQENELYAMSASSYNKCFESKDLAVVSGEIIFAGWNEEKDANGQPKMTNEFVSKDGKTVAPRPRKPHYDVSIKCLEPEGGESDGKRYVLHKIKAYAVTKPDGKVDTKYIDMLKKFIGESYSQKSSDKKFYGTFVTTPGEIRSYQTVKEDKEYTNFECNHLGIRTFDINELGEREKGEQQSTKAPAKEATGSGLNENAVPAADKDDIDDFFPEK